MDEEQIKVAGNLMAKLFMESEKRDDLSFAAFSDNKQYIRKYIKDHGGDLYSLKHTEEEFADFVFNVCFESNKKISSCVVATTGIIKTFGLESSFNLEEYVKTHEPSYEKLIKKLMSDDIYYELILIYCAVMSQLVFEKDFLGKEDVNSKISDLLNKLKNE